MGSLLGRGLVFAAVVSTLACSAADDGESLPSQAGTGGVSAPGAGGQASTGGVSGVGGGGSSAGAQASGGGATGGVGSAPGSGGASAIFDWPEGETASGPCLPGKYVGTFKCLFNDPTNPFVPPNLEVTGPVTFTLTESTRGEFLEISDGTLDGSAMLFIQFVGPLEGELDCAAKEFQATVTNGTSLAGPFSGKMDGKLDPTTQTLAGKWSLTPATYPDGACVGPWSVTRQP